ncbi:MAG: hypothetical protein ACI4TH_04505, partial [Candidatus Ornithomonoglobus sp.]
MKILKKIISLIVTAASLSMYVPCAMAESIGADIACDTIRMLQSGMYSAHMIVVGRGRTTYLNFTLPEGDYTKAELNLRREKGQAWGKNEADEKEYDKAYYRIIPTDAENGVNAEPQAYTEITLNGKGNEDQKIDITEALSEYTA